MKGTDTHKHLNTSPKSIKIKYQTSSIKYQVCSIWYLVSSIKYQDASRSRKEQVIAIWKFLVIFTQESSREACAPKNQNNLKNQDKLENNDFLKIEDYLIINMAVKMRMA